MNDTEKLKKIKEHITALKYLNSILVGAMTHQEEIDGWGQQFTYLSKIMDEKFTEILKTF